MRIGIIGYGRMGKVIERIALERKHEVVSILDKSRPDQLSAEVDCYIDFSVAEAVYENLPKLCELKVPVVIGATGWLAKKAEYEKLFIDSGNKGIWGGNFSLGVNLFFKVAKTAVKEFDKFKQEYDIMIHEFHHKNKIDSPSGTALHAAEIVLQNSSLKNEIVIDALQRQRKDNELHVSSTRGGAIPGIHNLIFDSTFDTVELTHTARSREGFALGSVIAAEKIGQVQVGLYNFSDIFDTIF